MTRPNMTNGGLTYSEAVANFLLRQAGIAEREYFYGLCIGEFGERASLSQVRAHLLGLVSIVFGSCAEKEMLGVHARWVVAFMQNAQLIWNRTFVQNPRGTVRRDQVPSGEQYCPVAVKRLASCPLPATSLHDHKAAFKSWFQAPVHVALLWHMGRNVNSCLL